MCLEILMAIHCSQKGDEIPYWNRDHGFLPFRPPFRHFFSFVHISVTRNSLIRKNNRETFCSTCVGSCCRNHSEQPVHIVKFSAWQIYNLRGVERGFCSDGMLFYLSYWGKSYATRPASRHAQFINGFWHDFFSYVEEWTLSIINPVTQKALHANGEFFFLSLPLFFSLFLCFLFLFVCLLLSFSLSSILLYNFFFKRNQ